MQADFGDWEVYCDRAGCRRREILIGHGDCAAVAELVDRSLMKLNLTDDDREAQVAAAIAVARGFRNVSPERDGANVWHCPDCAKAVGRG